MILDKDPYRVSQTGGCRGSGPEPHALTALSTCDHRGVATNPQVRRMIIGSGRDPVGVRRDPRRSLIRPTGSSASLNLPNLSRNVVDRPLDATNDQPFTATGCPSRTARSTEAPGAAGERVPPSSGTQLKRVERGSAARWRDAYGAVCTYTFHRNYSTAERISHRPPAVSVT